MTIKTQKMRFICTAALLLISLLLRAQGDIQIEDLNQQEVDALIRYWGTGSPLYNLLERGSEQLAKISYRGNPIVVIVAVG